MLYMTAGIHKSVYDRGVKVIIIIHKYVREFF